MDYNPLFSLFILMLKWSSVLSVTDTSGWLLCYFETSPAFLEHLPTLGHGVTFQAPLQRPGGDGPYPLWLPHLVQPTIWTTDPLQPLRLRCLHTRPAHVRSLFIPPRLQSPEPEARPDSPRAPAPPWVLGLLPEGTSNPPTQAPKPRTRFPSHEVALLTLIRLLRLVPGTAPPWTPPRPHGLQHPVTHRTAPPALAEHLPYHLLPGGDTCHCKPPWI